MRRQLKRAALAISGASRIVLAGHVNPDGDTLGCTLALAHALKALGKEVTVLSSDGVPDIYRWMPGAEWVVTSTPLSGFDLAIVSDAGALERIGRSLVPTIESARLILDIDHHVTDSAFGDIRLLDSTAAATAEIIWRLLRVLERAVERSVINKDVADCLMAGIITDTGSFRFLNVTPRTFTLAATLERLGALPAPIAELVFENRSFASLKLLGRALDRLSVTPGGTVAWSYVTAADFDAVGATDQDTEGIVNHVRAVQGTRIGILFREIPGRKVRISLRAREGTDVNRIAQVFGGGGHKLAAGCSVDPPLESAMQAVIAESERQLAAGSGE
jgi:phosphoesterase RecJ-like protein